MFGSMPAINNKVPSEPPVLVSPADTGTIVSNTLTPTIPSPGGIELGDLIIVAGASYQGGYTWTGAMPAGWVVVHDDSSSMLGSSYPTKVWAHIADAADVAASDFAFGLSSAAGGIQSMAITVWRPVNGTQFDDIQSVYSGNMYPVPASGFAADVTTVEPNSLVLSLWFYESRFGNPAEVIESVAGVPKLFDWPSNPASSFTRRNRFVIWGEAVAAPGVYSGIEVEADANDGGAAKTCTIVIKPS